MKYCATIKKERESHTTWLGAISLRTFLSNARWRKVCINKWYQINILRVCMCLWACLCVCVCVRTCAILSGYREKYGSTSMSFSTWLIWSMGFPCRSAGEESPCNARDLGSIPGLGRSLGERKGYPLQYSGLENSMDCTVHGIAKSRTWLSNFHFQTLSFATNRNLD